MLTLMLMQMLTPMPMLMLMLMPTLRLMQVPLQRLKLKHPFYQDIFTVCIIHQYMARYCPTPEIYPLPLRLEPLTYHYSLPLISLFILTKMDTFT